MTGQRQYRNGCLKDIYLLRRWWGLQSLAGGDFSIRIESTRSARPNADLGCKPCRRLSNFSWRPRDSFWTDESAVTQPPLDVGPSTGCMNRIRCSGVSSTKVYTEETRGVHCLSGTTRRERQCWKRGALQTGLFTVRGRLCACPLTQEKLGNRIPLANPGEAPGARAETTCRRNFAREKTANHPISTYGCPEGAVPAVYYLKPETGKS